MKLRLTKKFQISLIVNPPKIFRVFSKNLIWRIESEEKKLFLTFDDGPDPDVTTWVLDLLDNFGAKATFFCLGANVLKYPETYNQVIKKGHRVGNHSHSHLKGFRTGIRKYLSDVFKAEQYIQSNLFRPPYGMIRTMALRKLKKKYKIILWDVLSMDYDNNIQSRQVVRNVITNARAGSIIVFHDSKKAEQNLKYALPRLLDFYSKRGYEFVPLPE